MSILRKICCFSLAIFTCTVFADPTIRIFNSPPYTSNHTYSWGYFGLSTSGRFVRTDITNKACLIFSKSDSNNSLLMAGPNTPNTNAPEWAFLNNIAKLLFSKDNQYVFALANERTGPLKKALVWKVDDLANEQKECHDTVLVFTPIQDSCELIPTQTGRYFCIHNSGADKTDCYFRLNDYNGYEQTDLPSGYKLNPDFSQGNFYNYIVAQPNNNTQEPYLFLGNQLRTIPQDTCHIGKSGNLLLAQNTEAPEEFFKYYLWNRGQHSYEMHTLKNKYFSEIKELKPGIRYACNDNNQLIYTYHNINNKKLIFLIYNRMLKKWNKLELQNIPYQTAALSSHDEPEQPESILELTPLGSHKTIALLTLDNSFTNSKEYYLLDLNSKNPSAAKLADLLRTPGINMNPQQETIFQVLYEGRGDAIQSGTYNVILTQINDNKQFRIVEINYSNSNFKLLEPIGGTEFHPSSATPTGDTIIGFNKNRESGKIESQVISNHGTIPNIEGLEWIATNSSHTLFSGTYTEPEEAVSNFGTPKQIGYVKTTTGNQQLHPYQSDTFRGLTSRVTAMLGSHPPIILGESSSDCKTKACIWKPDYITITLDSQPLEPTLLETPSGCKYSSPHAISKNGNVIVGQYSALNSGNPDNFKACCWTNEQFIPLFSPSNHNYADATAVATVQGKMVILGQSGNLHNKMHIHANACLWVKGIPYFLDNSETPSIASTIAFRKGWVFGIRGGEHHRISGITDGKAFIYTGQRNGIQDLKEWILTNYSGFSGTLEQVSLETVSWVSDDGEVIMGMARDIDNKLKGYKIDLSSATRLTPQDQEEFLPSPEAQLDRANNDNGIFIIDTEHALTIGNHLTAGDYMVINHHIHKIKNIASINSNIQILDLTGPILNVKFSRPELDEETNAKINSHIISNALQNVDVALPAIGSYGICDNSSIFVVDTNHLLATGKFPEIGSQVVVNHRMYNIIGSQTITNNSQLLEIANPILDSELTKPELEQDVINKINCAIIADALR